MPEATPAVKPADAAPAAKVVTQALESLKTYDRGSGRAALLPVDQAVAAASRADDSTRKALEEELVTSLRAGGSAVAREYLCAKLALIGSTRAAAALGELLGDPLLATGARNALEAMPLAEAGPVLRERLAQLKGLAKVGAINSLGKLRDVASTDMLIGLLKDPEPEIAAAAACALGGIGSAQAADALRDFYARAAETLRRRTGDALLSCAERLIDTGHRGAALGLYRVLDQAGTPAHVRDAAQRGVRAG